MAVQLLFKISVVINLLNQLLHNLSAGFSLIVGVVGNHGFSVIVDAFNFQNNAVFVVFHFNLRIYAQQDCAKRGSVLRGCRALRSVAAGSKGSGKGDGKCKGQ